MPNASSLVSLRDATETFNNQTICVSMETQLGKNLFECNSYNLFAGSFSAGHYSTLFSVEQFNRTRCVVIDPSKGVFSFMCNSNNPNFASYTDSQTQLQLQEHPDLSNKPICLIAYPLYGIYSYPCFNHYVEFVSLPVNHCLTMDERYGVVSHSCSNSTFENITTWTSGGLIAETEVTCLLVYKKIITQYPCQSYKPNVTTNNEDICISIDPPHVNSHHCPRRSEDSNPNNQANTTGRPPFTNYTICAKADKPEDIDAFACASGTFAGAFNPVSYQGDRQSLCVVIDSAKGVFNFDCDSERINFDNYLDFQYESQDHPDLSNHTICLVVFKQYVIYSYACSGNRSKIMTENDITICLTIDGRGVLRYPCGANDPINDVTVVTTDIRSHLCLMADNGNISSHPCSTYKPQLTGLEPPETLEDICLTIKPPDTLYSYHCPRKAKREEENEDKKINATVIRKQEEVFVEEIIVTWTASFVVSCSSGLGELIKDLVAGPTQLQPKSYIHKGIVAFLSFMSINSNVYFMGMCMLVKPLPKWPTSQLGASYWTPFFLRFLLLFGPNMILSLIAFKFDYRHWKVLVEHPALILQSVYTPFVVGKTRGQDGRKYLALSNWFTLLNLGLNAALFIYCYGYIGFMDYFNQNGFVLIVVVPFLIQFITCPLLLLFVKMEKIPRKVILLSDPQGDYYLNNDNTITPEEPEDNVIVDDAADSDNGDQFEMEQSTSQYSPTWRELNVRHLAAEENHHLSHLDLQRKAKGYQKPSPREIWI